MILIFLYKIFEFNFLKILFKSILKKFIKRFFVEIKYKYNAFITHHVTLRIDIAWEDAWHVD